MSLNKRVRLLRVDILLKKNSEAVLCGWIDIAPQKIEIFFFFINKKDIKQVNSHLSSDNLTELFRSIKFD